MSAPTTVVFINPTEHREGLVLRTLINDGDVNPKASPDFPATSPSASIGREQDVLALREPPSGGSRAGSCSQAREAALLSPTSPHPCATARAEMCNIHCHGARGRQRQVQVEKHMAEIKNENHMSQPGRKAVTCRL